MHKMKKSSYTTGFKCRSFVDRRRSRRLCFDSNEQMLTKYSMFLAICRVVVGRLRLGSTNIGIDSRAHALKLRITK